MNPEKARRNHGTLRRRRLLTGGAVAGAAAVASQLSLPEASADPAPVRTDSLYYYTSQEKSLGYSQGIQVGDIVWLSGTAALDQDFNVVAPGDLAAQMAFIYARIRESLARFRLDLRYVVRENMYVTDMDALNDALPFRKSMYGNGPFPTSTTVQVAQLLAPGLTIEIEVVATTALPHG